MLKKIRVDQLEVGMHLHRLCGSWLDHPFWSRRLTLHSRDDLDKLRASGIVECWIDASKGRDVAANDSDDAPVDVPAAIDPATPDDEPADSTSSESAPIPIEKEAVRAAALCLRSKKAVEALFADARMGRALSTDECLPLVDDIASSIWRHPGALISLARLKSHDDYSYMHSVAVCALMVVLGKQLGLDELECREAGLAGLLHDIGKSMMPLAILNKPGRLTEEEFAVMRTHPERGLELLADANRVSDVVLDVCGHHHERPDGRGYPHGLSGDALSLHARMGAVCDVYDAITSNRPYKDGWDPAESIARMSDWGLKGQFDPAVFQAFVESIGIYPTGSLVRLQSGRLAIVAEQNPASSLKPKVKVFFSTKSQMPMAPEILDLGRQGCSDRIVGRESNDKWKFPHLIEMVPGYSELRLGLGTRK
jgi:HD-GYP domain-containing protein (c-di-GMP phosphodiesterase class II)